jgi:hypothetical protein
MPDRVNIKLEISSYTSAEKFAQRREANAPDNPLAKNLYC